MRHFTGNPVCGTNLTALDRGAEALGSADPALAEVLNVRWVDPATPALRRLINR